MPLEPTEANFELSPRHEDSEFVHNHHERGNFLSSSTTPINLPPPIGYNTHESKSDNNHVQF